VAVASPYLHTLNCRKCGAALTPQHTRDQILICPYCQTSHVFDPPDPVSARAPARSQPRGLAFAIVGAALLALLAAGVVFSSNRPPRANVREDAKAYGGTPAPTSNPGDPNATYAEGQAVDIHWGSRWWPGQILKKDGKRYHIHYDGWSSSWDEWVEADRLKARAR
jgi:hypothetical protein